MSSTLFSSSVKNQGFGLVTAAVVLFLLGVGGSGALYGSYVHPASTKAPAVAVARL